MNFLSAVGSLMDGQPGNQFGQQPHQQMGQIPQPQQGGPTNMFGNIAGTVGSFFDGKPGNALGAMFHPAQGIPAAAPAPEMPAPPPGGGIVQVPGSGPPVPGQEPGHQSKFKQLAHAFFGGGM